MGFMTRRNLARRAVKTAPREVSEKAKALKETSEVPEKAEVTEEVSHETKLVVSRDEVNAMQYFKIKSVAEANGIDTEGKKTVELREAVIEKLGL